MIRRLRVRHRRTFTVLAVLLPLGFFAAIAARPEFPVSATSPDELLGRAGEQNARGPVLVRSNGKLFLEVRPEVDPELPDVLLYLVPGQLTDDELRTGGLPGNALLLGSLAGTQSRRFPLPDDFVEGGSTLVSFSLAHGEVVSRIGI